MSVFIIFKVNYFFHAKVVNSKLIVNDLDYGKIRHNLMFTYL